MSPHKMRSQLLLGWSQSQDCGVAGGEGMAEGWGTQGGAFLVHSELSIPSLTWLCCLYLVIASEGSSFLAGAFISCYGEKSKECETQGPLKRPGQIP